MVELISNRPSEFAEAMDAFTDLLSLAIRVVNGELSRHAENSTKEKSSLCDELDTNNVAVMKLNGTSFGAPAGGKVVLPLSLLETTAVILSIWRSKSENADDEERTVVSAVNDLVNAMMRSSSDEGEDFDEDDDTGLAGAKRLDSEVTALSVESVSIKFRIVCLRDALHFTASSYILAFTHTHPVDNTCEGTK